MSGRMSKHDAMDFADSCDLPDGAYWAMIEEMSGAKPSDFVDGGNYNPTWQEQKNYRKANRLSNLNDVPRRLKHIESFGYTVKKITEHHYQINGKFEWWPSSLKWKAFNSPRVYKGFEQMMQSLRKGQKS